MKTKIIIATVFLLLFAWSIYPQERVFTERPTPLKNPILAPDELFFTSKVSDNCSITLNEAQHQTYARGRGANIIATDVGCGFRSEVIAPDYLDSIRVYKVDTGYSSIFGDYIELSWVENGHPMKWILTHVHTRIKNGDIVVTGERIGQTNASGQMFSKIADKWLNSSDKAKCNSGERPGNLCAYHVHQELWFYDKNISYMDLYNRESEKRIASMNSEKPKEYTYDNKAIFDFVAQGEGAFQAEAFCDSYYKTNSKLIRKSPDDCTYWSIGFGTISHRGEVITEEEARRRKEADILRRKELITSNCLTQSQMMATVDFLYQMGSNRSGVKEMANRCDIEGIYNVLVSWRDNNAGLNRKGLVLRDQRRINIFKDTLLTQK